MPPAAQRSRETVLKNTKRKLRLQSGIAKRSSVPRRYTLGGTVGDRVIRPSSPYVTLPELLKEAEETLIMEEDGPIMHLSPLASSLHDRQDLRLKTPYRDGVSVLADIPPLTGPRDWTKADWKRLDSCYTDERLALGEHFDLPPGSLAPVEKVEIEHVVERFVELMGGQNAIDKLGRQWTRYVPDWPYCAVS